MLHWLHAGYVVAWSEDYPVTVGHRRYVQGILHEWHELLGFTYYLSYLLKVMGVALVTCKHCSCLVWGLSGTPPIRPVPQQCSLLKQTDIKIEIFSETLVVFENLYLILNILLIHFSPSSLTTQSTHLLHRYSTSSDMTSFITTDEHFQ